MAWLDLDQFTNMRSGDREPLLNMYWHCLELPFGGETSYVENVNIPFPSLGVRPIFIGGAYTQYPSFQEIAAFDITFHEDVALRSRKWLNKWLNLIRDQRTGAYGLPSQYRRPMKFALIAGVGPNPTQTVMTITLNNCWPTQSGAWDLANSSPTPLKLQQNFATDGIIYDETF